MRYALFLVAGLISVAQSQALEAWDAAAAAGDGADDDVNTWMKVDHENSPKSI